jgi:antitoxin YefM
MTILTFSETRKNFAATMDKVVQNREPVIVTRQNREPVVMISLSDFKSYEETIYLMQSVNNAGRLNRAIKSLERGEGTVRELIEE